MTHDVTKVMTATKMARRYLNRNMGDLQSTVQNAMLEEDDIPEMLVELAKDRRIVIDYNFLAGVHCACRLWFKLYRKADDKWKDETGIGINRWGDHD